MAALKSKITLLFLFSVAQSRITKLFNGLNNVADFALEYNKEINFDGLLGYVIAEAQLWQTKQMVRDEFISTNLDLLLNKWYILRNTIESNLLKNSTEDYVIFGKFLLKPRNWINPGKKFNKGELWNLGIYTDWTESDIVNDKEAYYKGVPSNYCLLEILERDCLISNFCMEMMLSPRIDWGYLLSHRLLYFQVARIKQCHIRHEVFRSYTNNFCSLMLKEAKTNEYLGFPGPDIFLEQVVLCGLEGYAEFLEDEWRKEILQFQTYFGCFDSGSTKSKRSSNAIAFGCEDHITGLGAAAMALSLRFILNDSN